uniref:Heme-binding protein 1 n=1 Tax=Callorhinchus milii TaxID=7868 RepID=A0A4W3J943_CALMI
MSFCDAVRKREGMFLSLSVLADNRTHPHPTDKITREQGSVRGEGWGGGGGGNVSQSLPGCEHLLLLLSLPGVGMGMTAPVTIRAHRGDQGGLQPGVLVQIRIPSKYQEQPPRPTDQSITVQHQEGFTVYSTHFGGYAKEADWVEHAGNLCAALGEQAAYHREHFLCAGYDPPMKPLGRRNEVWLVRQEPPE